MSDSNDGKYNGLRKKLETMGSWPQVYLFKFIIPNDNKTLALVESLFGSDAQVNLNQSRTGKYISVSAKELMISPEEVIERYKKSELIKGIISL